MKIAYKDILNHLSEKPSIKLLSEKLFQLGHEHEIYGEVFDMEFTPNRGDCLSATGLARDLNFFFGKSENIQVYEDEIEELEINFKNLSPKDCPQISFLEIDIEEVTHKYKPYLESYFSFSGNNKVNLFTDISNYISYELGQPTHCFDAENIKENLIFENKECTTKFKTLLGNDIELQDKNCIFSHNDEIISLAGVMGGASTACSSQTTKVLVECAYFNPESIIGKTIKYNLISDAAYKFERGVDIKAQETVLRRFIKIVMDHAKIKSLKFKSFTYSQYHHLSLPINIAKINAILGTEISKNDYSNYLKYLGFKIDDVIEVPSYRSDIKTQNDLAEEIARLIGYNNIPSKPVTLEKIDKYEEKNNILKIETFLTQNGFSQVINFPFTSINRKESIRILNPLDSNKNYLRTSTKESLIENLLYNERRQNDSVRLFEITDIYAKDKKLIQQKTLGIIASGRLGKNYNDFSKKIDFHYLHNLLNKNFTKDIFEINEIQRSDLETKKKDKIYFIEIYLENIPKSFFSDIKDYDKVTNFIKYKPISEFPSSTRDFSFSIDNIIKVDLVIDLLNEISDDLIKDSFIFDFYKDNKTKTVKLGYRFIFQSNTKTLSDHEINQKVQEILDPLLEIDGVSIPGM